MLIPVLGRAGTDGSAYLVKLIRTLKKKGEKVMFIVPEQFSFEAEKMIYRALPAADALGVEVYSFTRLCNKVFYTYGGIAGDYISDTAKHLLMYNALDEVADMLEIYRKSSRDTAFIETMLETVAEFKNAGILPYQLLEFCEQNPHLPMQQKVREIGNVYSVYQAMVDARYLDSDDELIRCCRILGDKDFFSGYTIIVDGFMTFMAGEFQLLRLMLEGSHNLYLSLCCDGLEDRQKGMGIFSTAKKTAARMINLAKSSGVPVAPAVIRTENKRFENEALAFLEKSFLSGEQLAYEGQQGAIHLIKATTPYEEIEYVAAQIADLTKEGDVRFREIAVIARSLDRYESFMEDVFHRYEIPIFMDQRREIETIAVVSVVLGALMAVQSSFSSEYVLSLCKNTVIGLDSMTVGLLENYVYIWDIHKGSWLKPFQSNPNGLSVKLSQEDLEELEKIEEARRKVIAPLLQLEQRLHNATGEAFAQAIYLYLEEIDAPSQMKNYAQAAPEYGEEYLMLNEKAWDVLMEVLDSFAVVMKERIVPLPKLIELLKIGIAGADFGMIPDTLDQVMVGIADRIRPGNPKITFVIGVNQGVFPMELGETGVFTDEERQNLAQGGIEISPPSLQRSIYELYFLYSALTTPRQQLFVSYYTGQFSGEQALPSMAIRELRNLFPHAEYGVEELPPLFYITNEETALDTACKYLRRDTPQTAALQSYLHTSSKKEKWKAILAMLQNTGFSLTQKGTAKKLFGTQMLVSPSGIERYHLCPFSYFCSYGLSLYPRRKVEFSPLQSGEVIHYVLEKMLKANTPQELSLLTEEAIMTQVQSHLNDYLDQRKNSEDKLPKRFDYLFLRLVGTLTRLVMHLAQELSQSEFVPVGFEMLIGKDGDIAPLTVETQDGTQVVIQGIVDRVDLMDSPNGKYVRVVDYKSGEKKFRLADIYYGLNLQMMIYLCTLWEKGVGELSGALPGGILYMPAKDKILPVQRHTEEDVVQREHQKERKMNGLILNDYACIKGMEREMDGVYIPVKQKKDSTDQGESVFRSDSSLATLAQMGRLRKYIDRLICKMADSLQEGNIPAVPTVGLDYDPCKYCDYLSICRREEGMAEKEISDMKREEFFDLLTEEKEEQSYE